jgi:hypothetical protein
MSAFETTHVSASATYHVDEAGDGVLFGTKGRDRLKDSDAPKFFMLGMVRCAKDSAVAEELDKLRAHLLGHPLYKGIASMAPSAEKTARIFHAKDDHPEVRAKVFELLTGMDFKFYAVIKDMRAVRDYVARRNQMDSSYRYHPNELYDLAVRMLFKQHLHKESRYRITFARRGKSDRTKALVEQLDNARLRFLEEHRLEHEAELNIRPAYPWQEPCLQVADYCLWALQRCYERLEDRFLQAIWPKVSLVHDVDDPEAPAYGKFFTRKSPTPDLAEINNRWI